MSNYFIIHGMHGNAYENWFPWLEKKLAERDLMCFVPHFPTPVQQSYANWEKLLNYYNQLGFIDENTTFIAHSLGPVFIAKYLISNKVKSKGLFSIAGFNNFVSGIDGPDELNKSFYLANSELSQLKNFVNIRHCFFSENDPHLPLQKLREFADVIEAVDHVIPDGGHFNSAAGYQEFPQLLELIIPASR